MSYNAEKKLVCDMSRDCAAPVAYVDARGWTYCASHGLQRQRYEPCRKLRRHELKRLERGEPLKKY